MERARHKIEEAIKKQKWLQEQSHAKTESSSAKDKSQYMIALGGIAAGLTIAVIFMLSKSLVTKEHTNMFSADQDNAIQTVEIGKPSDEIVMLNERVESLSKSVSKLEDQLTHVIALADSTVIVERKHAASSSQEIPVPAGVNSIVDIIDSHVSSVVDNIPETGEAFIPSHTVEARVNLRPSASLHTTPIAVLNVGTEVEYIRKSDGWYYVNTLAHGKGWCSSEYLSPLSPTQ